MGNRAMWCYFVRNGCTVATRELRGATVQEAIERARLLFEQRRDLYDTFEVWSRGRMAYQHLPSESKIAVWPNIRLG